ncbi:MAG: ABC transporter ATP-binding protein [Planctomycetaceae bacterium]|jgi:ABC-2 type transport system ATP-binding protein|nr:ABC transporter ATP-binding protein [Planctomycetaceae bacterium]
MASISAETLAIDVQHLSKTYREGLLFPRVHPALKDVSLQVKAGEVFGLLGPNGAGKTTLIKVLLGILHPTNGLAQVLKEPAGSKAARRKIGYLPENLVFPRHHTGRSALYFYGRLSEMSDSQIAARENELFDLVSLQGRQNEAVRRYSKGMRQRLGLAQAMLHDPDLLILDEPTDGLDPMGRSQIRDVLDKLKQRGKTVFLNSHILQEVELICDRVAIMALGQLRGIGTIDELIRSHTNDQSGSVKLEVLAIPSQIRQIESLPANTMIESIDLGRLSQDGLSRIAVDNIDQAGVDSLVDQLRSAQISILRIERARPSLEQVFMNIVGAAKP